MKTPLFIFVLSVSFFCLFKNTGLPAEAGPEEIVQKFYWASAEGDLEVMKMCIAGHFYERRKTLIEKNKGYADFLKDHYAGVITEVMSVEVDDAAGQATVVIKNTYQGGSSFNTTLLLSEENGGSWKINDEHLPD
jgi:hypothetical protein